MSYYCLGKYDDALEWYLKIPETHSDYSNAVLQLYNIYLKKGDYKKALEYGMKCKSSIFVYNHDYYKDIISQLIVDSKKLSEVEKLKQLDIGNIMFHAICKYL